jgi:RNase adapter protein RapZ
MSSKKIKKRPKKADKEKRKKKKTAELASEHRGELVILTGLSGSGKLSALKAFEDLG